MPSLFALPSGAQRLDHEERVALGVTVELVCVQLLQRAPGDPLGKDGCILSGEPAEVDLRESSQGMQTGAQVVQGMPAVDFFAPRSGRDEQAGFRLNPQEVVEELQRFPVPPVKVVGHQH